MGLGAWEFVSLFKMAGYHPSRSLIIGGTMLFIFARFFNNFEYTHLLLSAALLASMTYHLILFERDKLTKSGSDFAITLAGILYFGWFGGFFISLRALPNGFWWLFLTLGTVWMVDVGGYAIGRPFGKHFFFPNLSPKKTWEGYFGGILGGILGGCIVILFWYIFSPSSFVQENLWYAIILGIILALFTPLGDLGESMVKRQAGVKDSSNLIPGHGGVWDRIDSWLWSACIGYYVISIWFL